MMKTNKICCIGAGYVGGPTMAVIAKKCPNIEITIVDSNEERINLWKGKLNSLPIFEPGLKEIIKDVRDKNLFFSTNIDEAIQNCDIIFIAVNTPTLTSGPGKGFGADLQFVKDCAKRIGQISKSNKIIVEKSTVPIKTAEAIKEILDNENDQFTFEILSNPEFLAEGTAINDLLNPDRVIIGGNNTESGKQAINTLVDIYSKWVDKDKILTTNVWSSELSKLASNAMLAQRVSSINSLSAICNKTGADIIEVSKAIGMDTRIGNKFLKPSVGFGGSCFQKDILNLVYLCNSFGLHEVADYWHQVVKINDYQKERFVKTILLNLNSPYKDKTITIFGWSFKKNTNDSRHSPAIQIAHRLISNGIKLNIYDPKSSIQIIHNDLNEFSNEQEEIDLSLIKFYNDPYEASKKSSCIAVLTEWDEFIKFDWKSLVDNLIDQKYVIDGRYIIKKTDEINFIDF